MRTTIDLPDPIYRELKVRAAHEGTTIRGIILESVAARLKNQSEKASVTTAPRFPVIRSKHPGSLKLGEEGVYEYIPFP
jgi:hypothetical protein